MIIAQFGEGGFFVRPRRFGKSLMADMLRCYYDKREKENFQFKGDDLVRLEQIAEDSFES